MLKYCKTHRNGVFVTGAVGDLMSIFSGLVIGRGEPGDDAPGSFSTDRWIGDSEDT